MRKIFAMTLLAFALVACDQAGDVGQQLPDQAEAAVKVKPGFKNPAILPAYKLPGEDRVPGKQDAASDFRKAHPQWYAITEPPPAQYRPMKEWEPMEAIIITYSNYLPGDPQTAKTMADIVVGSVDVGKVWVVVESDAAKNDLLNRVKDGGLSDQQIEDQIVFFNIENDAIWMIDFGPLPMVDDEAGTQIWQDFRYYHQRVLDDAIPTRLANRLDITTYRSPFDFEGGNFQADGEEFCYTTERLYYYTGLDYDGVNDVFKTYYGCKEAVVLKDITNDGTGHVDMFFKLGGKNTAFMGEYTVVNDPTNKQRMDDNVAILDALKYTSGGGIKTYRIPMPNAGKSGSESIPRTFINSTLFVSADGQTKVNLWPMYTVDKDLEAEALDAWEEGLPGWDHIGIVSDQISLYSGAIHCVTRTVPALPLEKAIADGTCVDGACQGADGAYDGVCIAGSEEDPGCWGPQWECLCNICNAAGCEIPASCGDGTCDASENCFSCAADCGCGVDQACSVVTGQCGSDTCGNGTCDDGENCLSCAADCGCKNGESCSFGICTDDPCGGITYDGCCDGDDSLVYCDGGDLVVMGCQGGGCGWTADKSWYDCGGNGEDPSGEKPRSCGEFSYPPGCDGKECGDNGGGYSCGECADGMACNDGVCGDGPVCSCEGKECGDDGCGGDCGACDAGFVCEANTCVEDTCVPSCDGLECGDDGCGGECGTCDAGFVCEANACVEEGTNPEAPAGDIVTSEDMVEIGEDAVIGADVGGEEPKKKSSDGCTAGSSGSGSGLALVLVGFAMMLAVLRRRSVLS
jgi:agmatine/peptidylarginine deiminase